MRCGHHLPLALCFLIAGAWGAPAAAQDSGPVTAASGTVTGNDIQRDQEEIAILEQELRIAQLKKQIREAGAKETDPSKLASVPIAAAPATTPAPPAASAAPPAPPPPLPRVVSISGIGNHLTATLRLADGGEVIARPAMGLPGGLIVHDVSADGVRVIQDGDLVTLPFGGGPVRPAAATQPQVIQLPPFSQAPAVHVPPIPGVPGR